MEGRITGLQVWHRDKLQTQIKIGESGEVTVAYFSDDVNTRGFNVPNPVWKDVLDFLETRCVPRTRANIKEILQDFGLSTYSPLSIVRKTHGVLWDDFIWIRFDGEDVTFDDVRVR